MDLKQIVEEMCKYEQNLKEDLVNLENIINFMKNLETYGYDVGAVYEGLEKQRGDIVLYLDNFYAETTQKMTELKELSEQISGIAPPFGADNGTDGTDGTDGPTGPTGPTDGTDGTV